MGTNFYLIYFPVIYFIPLSTLNCPGFSFRGKFVTHEVDIFWHKNFRGEFTVSDFIINLAVACKFFSANILQIPSSDSS